MTAPAPAYSSPPVGDPVPGPEASQPRRPKRRLVVRARWCAWLSYTSLFAAGVAALVSIWAGGAAMTVALAGASVGLALMLAAVMLLLADRRQRR